MSLWGLFYKERDYVFSFIFSFLITNRLEHTGCRTKETNKKQIRKKVVCRRAPAYAGICVLEGEWQEIDVGISNLINCICSFIVSILRNNWRVCEKR